MSDLKTRPTDESVTKFLNSVDKEQQREDSFAVMELMREVTGDDPQMWGPSIVGFGRYTYKYASGKENEWMLTGFSPRKRNLTLYIMDGFDEYDDIMSRLGKHTTGKSCLYIKRLDDVDEAVLRELVAKSIAHMKATNETN